MKRFDRIFIVLLVLFGCINPLLLADDVVPIRSEIITPIRNESFNKNGKCPERKLGGNPRVLNNVLVFDGASDGNRQVDPQIAVGGDHVLHATNNGLIIYSKKGEFIQGVRSGVSMGELIRSFSTTGTMKSLVLTFGILGTRKRKSP